MDASERRVSGRRTRNSCEVQKTKLRLFFLFLMSCLSFRRAHQDRKQGLTSFFLTSGREELLRVPSPPADQHHQALLLTELQVRTTQHESRSERKQAILTVNPLFVLHGPSLELTAPPCESLQIHCSCWCHSVMGSSSGPLGSRGY